MKRNLLCDQVGLAAGLQRLYVRPTCVLPKHLDVYQTYKQLLEPSLIQLRIFESGLENLDFLAD